MKRIAMFTAMLVLAACGPKTETPKADSAMMAPAPAPAMAPSMMPDSAMMRDSMMKRDSMMRADSMMKKKP